LPEAGLVVPYRRSIWRTRGPASGNAVPDRSSGAWRRSASALKTSLDSTAQLVAPRTTRHPFGPPRFQIHFASAILN
jgi:hypothetical protein